MRFRSGASVAEKYCAPSVLWTGAAVRPFKRTIS
jgi:hypothetical protein